MSSRRKFDACIPRPKFNARRGDVWWHKIGRAFENDKGQIHIYLNSLPLINAEGDTQITLFEARDEPQQEEQPAEQASTKKATKKATGKDDDEVPWR